MYPLSIVGTMRIQSFDGFLLMLDFVSLQD
jgi:hypothetical protein